MKQLLLLFEPIIWLLFGQGILLGTILLTGWLLVVGLGVPLGIVPAEALSYERAHALGSNIIGRLVLFALCALPLWKGAHHMRSLSIDFGGASRDALVATLLYALAAAGSAVALIAVVRL
jgi:fumarate reductase subunit D